LIVNTGYLVVVKVYHIEAVCLLNKQAKPILYTTSFFYYCAMNQQKMVALIAFSSIVLLVAGLLIAIPTMQKAQASLASDIRSKVKVTQSLQSSFLCKVCIRTVCVKC
jgi:hypothetical protein